MHEEFEVPRRLGNCRLIRPIGRGGMGEVWLANMRGLAKPCVVKVLLPKYSANPEYRRRFHREARILALLNHQRIVTIHDYGESEGWLYIVMDYVDGVDLGTFCRALRKNSVTMPASVAAYIIGEILEALHHAHGGKGKGVIHRDITPGNVMISSNGEVYLTDFGLARHETELSSEIFGTLSFMAPEQAMGNACFQSDLFGVGGLLLFMLTGRPPRQAKNVAQLLENLSAIDCVTGRDDVPEVVQRLMELCLATSPEDRLATAKDGLLLLKEWPECNKESMVIRGLYRSNVGPEKTGLTGVHEAAEEVVDPKGGTVRVEPGTRLEEPEEGEPEAPDELPERTLVLDWQPGMRGKTERVGTAPGQPADAPARLSATERSDERSAEFADDVAGEERPEAPSGPDQSLEAESVVDGSADAEVPSVVAPDPSEAGALWEPWWEESEGNIEAAAELDDDTTQRFLPPPDQAEPDAPRIFRRPRRRFLSPPDGDPVGPPAAASGRPSSSPSEPVSVVEARDVDAAPPPEPEPPMADERSREPEQRTRRPRDGGGGDARALIVLAVFIGLGLVAGMAMSTSDTDGDASAEVPASANADSPPEGPSQPAPEVGTHARTLP